MADFEPPSFSLGLDFDLFDSTTQITPTTHQTHPSSANHFSVVSATLNDEDNEFETLVVEDSEPEDPDPHPKRLRCGFTKAELNSTDKHNVVCTGPNIPAGDLNNEPVNRKQHVSNEGEVFSTSCSNMVFTKLVDSHVRGFQSADSCSDSHDIYVGGKCDGSDLNSNIGKYDVSQRVREDLPKGYCYFFHDDPRIQELVRSRLPNFSILGNMLNIDLEQPSTSKIDYMGQFRFGESSRQAARTNKNKKSSRKSETDEMSQGWVNPKLGVAKIKTKGAVKRKVHTRRHTAGHWLTDSDGKKVYVGKSGKELTGRGAYMQYKKENGLGFKKVKRKSVTKKNK